MRIALLLLASLLVLTAVEPARADTFPSKPIRIVTITPPGAVSDTLARMVTEQLHRDTGADFIVEYKPGASGMIASEYVAHAPPDGYTILLSTISSHAQNPSMFKTMRYDPIADFESVCRLALFQWVLVSDPALGFQNLNDLIAAAKAAPGKFTVGYSTASALAASDAFSTRAGIKVLPVGYKGQPLALNGVMGSQVSYMLIDVASAAPLIASGRLKGLAVASDRRSPLLPDVPTYQEAGVSGADFIGWSGFSAPANTPEPVVRWLTEHVKAAMEQPDLKDRLNRQGILPGYLPPAAYKSFIQQEIVVWNKRIRDANIEPE